jgi:L-asparaginase II
MITNNNLYQPIFELTRGKIIESIHFGAVVVVDAQGRLVASYGDPQAVTYLRSSAKPFQVLPLIEHGGQAVYQLAPREIALICASHTGTDEHVHNVRAIQQKIGVQESDLLCGVHPPFDPATLQAMHARGEQPTPNRHNCSGKHTGMLAYTRMKNLPVREAPGSLPYIDPLHPIQQEILQTFAEMCELPREQVQLGTDGCSVPTFAVPLYNAALAYARLCDPQAAGLLSPPREEACRTITAAMTRNPDMVGGPNVFDTRLMQAGKGRILAKRGAEGFLSMGLLPGALGENSPALGIAIKIADGDLGAHTGAAGDYRGHARPAVGLEVLRQLGALSPAELESLADYGPTFEITNWRKLVVGQGRPCFMLKVEG